MYVRRFLFMGGCVAVIVAIAVSGYLSLFPNEQPTASKSVASPSQLIQTVRTANEAPFAARAPKTVFDTTGVKTSVQQAFFDNAASIAEQTGMSESAVEASVTALDVPSWTAVDLPGTATVNATYQIECDGTTAELITYLDKSYLTVSLQGQATTLSVPQNAQQYLSYLGYV
ncbi:MAG: hypothetical protein K6F70_05690 [Eggerthellaceae bacterium]|nr:hypothetical protein [Eggerthellaceae bacterium]